MFMIGILMETCSECRALALSVWEGVGGVCFVKKHSQNAMNAYVHYANVSSAAQHCCAGHGFCPVACALGLGY